MNKMKGIPRFNRCLLVAFFRRFFVFAHSLPALVIVPSPIQQHNRIIASFIRIVLCEHVWLVFCCFIFFVKLLLTDDAVPFKQRNAYLWGDVLFYCCTFALVPTNAMMEKQLLNVFRNSRIHSTWIDLERVFGGRKTNSNWLAAVWTWPWICQTGQLDRTQRWIVKVIEIGGSLFIFSLLIKRWNYFAWRKIKIITISPPKTKNFGFDTFNDIFFIVRDYKCFANPPQ